MQTKTALTLTIIVSNCYDMNGQTEAEGRTEAVAGRQAPSLHGRPRIECVQTKARSEGWGEGARMDVSVVVISLSRS